MRPLALLVVIATALPGADTAPGERGRDGGDIPQPPPIGTPANPPAAPRLSANRVCALTGRPVDQGIAPIELGAAQCPHHPELRGKLLGVCSKACAERIELHPGAYEERIRAVCGGEAIAKGDAPAEAPAGSASDAKR